MTESQHLQPRVSTVESALQTQSSQNSGFPWLHDAASFGFQMTKKLHSAAAVVSRMAQRESAAVSTCWDSNDLSVLGVAFDQHGVHLAKAWVNAEADFGWGTLPWHKVKSDCLSTDSNGFLSRNTGEVYIDEWAPDLSLEQNRLKSEIVANIFAMPQHLPLKVVRLATNRRKQSDEGYRCSGSIRSMLAASEGFSRKLHLRARIHREHMRFIVGRTKEVRLAVDAMRKTQS